MSLTRYNRNGLLARDPFALARDFFGTDFVPTTQKAVEFAPGFDVKETESAYVISADLPGVKDEDVDISLSGKYLTISGKRDSEEKKDGESFHVYERTFGSFTRTFALPNNADADAVSADLSSGVLQVTVAKKAQKQPRKIAIKTQK